MSYETHHEEIIEQIQYIMCLSVYLGVGISISHRILPSSWCIFRGILTVIIVKG